MVAVTRRRRRGGAVTTKCECDGPDNKGCTNPTVPGTFFCKEHQTCPLPPLSGYEPAYTPDLYNRDPAVQTTHNCLMYAVLTNVIRKDLVRKCREKNLHNCRDLFYQPGEASGERNGLDASVRRTCPVVEKLLLSDNPSIEKSTYRDRCPAGTSKIAIAVDPANDYHLWVQTKDGAVPDKPGQLPVVRRTFNPEHATRNYGDLNYEDFCGFYCVPRVGSVRLGPGDVISLEAAQQGGTRRSRRSQRSQRAQPTVLRKWVLQGGQTATLWSQSPLTKQPTRTRRRTRRTTRRK